jgi:hypothetical protein
MNHTQIRPIVVLMALGFTVTLGVLRGPRAPRAPLPTPAPLPTTSQLPPLPASTRDSRDDVLTAASRPLARQATATASAIEVPPSDDNAPPLPVMFRVSSYPAPREDDDAGTAAAAGSAGVAQRVDLFNNSSDPLSITVLAVDVPTQGTTRADLLVPPRQQAHVGSESGLKLASGYQITLRSRGYRELTQTVP